MMIDVLLSFLVPYLITASAIFALMLVVNAWFAFIENDRVWPTAVMLGWFVLFGLAWPYALCQACLWLYRGYRLASLADDD